MITPFGSFGTYVCVCVVVRVGVRACEMSTLVLVCVCITVLQSDGEMGEGLLGTHKTRARASGCGRPPA